MINASLGSHYSADFVWQSLKQLSLALIGKEDNQDKQDLANVLTDFFPGKIDFVYKGRDAIELCLQQYGITNNQDGVITQAFTCSAIEEGILRAGATPIYADLSDNQLNLDAKTIDQAKQTNKNLTIKAVIVQHSLGHPAKIKEIRAWCNNNKVLLIEDLAQSFGATDTDDNLLGKTADAIILSFGRDKIIDAATGGAVIFKTQSKICQAPTLGKPKKIVIIRDLSYPVITWLIRKTYSFSFGKILHLLLKKINWLYSPVKSPTDNMTSMPSYFAKLALTQLVELDQTHEHRQQISEFYLKALTNLKIQVITTEDDLTNGSLLRLAITTPQWKKIITDWQQHGIHLSDRWYRQAVDCGGGICSAYYHEKSCPNAEKISSQILNLPTHNQISFGDAEKIVTIIKQHVN